MKHNDAQLSLNKVRETRRRIDRYIRTTPVWEWNGPIRDLLMPAGGTVVCKLEMLQTTGSFKPRGALSVMTSLSGEALMRGVTAVSAGNHAIAVAYAARVLGCTAKVVMMVSANPERVAACRAYGAEIVLAANVHEAFQTVRKIADQEGRIFVHPFEGEQTALGTATLGLEWIEQAPDLDVVIIPIGGGGLSAGVAAAIKQLRPSCAVFGVEPTGADKMHRSFLTGKPESIDAVKTIADSLGAPHAGEYTFSICRKYVNEIVLVDDDQIRQAMLLLFRGMKLAVEPAGAAATAALLGPLRERLAGKRVGLIVCGANIDPATFSKHLLGAVSL